MQRAYKKVVLSLLCGIVFSAVLPMEAESAAVRRHALLIGINEYGGGNVSPLSGTHNDIRLVRGLLSSRFDFASDDITVMLDEQATHTGIIDAIRDLSERVGHGDIVYIHFSGHGSRTPDAADNNRLKPTLIPFGARSGSADAADNLDDYDILSDQLKAVVAEISAKTENIAFVSDSCHSGTITRGADVLATRSVPDDIRPHPAIGAPVPDNVAWISVAACGVTELAREYRGDDGLIYGAFTWFWVRALQSSASGDTWQMVMDRTIALMRNAGIPQNPVLPDDIQREIFGGSVSEKPKKFTVIRSYPEVLVNVGTIAGVSENSEFQLEKEGKLTDVRLIVRKADAFACVASVEGGAAEVGDVAVLTKWQPSFTPLRVAFRADFPSDDGLLKDLQNLFVVSADELAAYEFVDDTSQSNMVLWVTRPKRDAGGNVLLKDARQITDPAGNIVGEERYGLPESEETEPPRIWVMDPSLNYPYNMQELLKEIPYDETGLNVLAQNLEKLSRLHGLYNMRLPEGDSAELEIVYRLFVPVATAEEWDAVPADARVELTRAPRGTSRRWRLNRTVFADALEFGRQPEEGLLSVRAINNSDNVSYHVYGVNATPDAKILPFLHDPVRGTEVKPGQTADFTNHLILTGDDEYVRVFATLKPINIQILSQEEITAARSGLRTRSLSNPIEAMLSRQVFPTRGVSASSALDPAEVTSMGTRFLR
jgi:hypothetical protein